MSASFVFPTVLVAVFPVPVAHGLSHAQALTTLLTVESLIFAALGVGVAVTAAVPGGRSPYLAEGKLARHIALALTLVAVAAGTAWWQVFMHPTRPRASWLGRRRSVWR